MTYMAEDFENARFAEHPSGDLAARGALNEHVPWHCVINGERRSDREMVENGWRPVVGLGPGARDEQTAYSQGYETGVATAGSQLKALKYAFKRPSDRVQEQTHAINELRPTLAPTDPLQDAWETAEVADECRAGDVLIRKNSSGNIRVVQSSIDSPIGFMTRIFARAPRREPWEDLADLLVEEFSNVDEEYLAVSAQILYEQGVRATDSGGRGDVERTTE